MSGGSAALKLGVAMADSLVTDCRPVGRESVPFAGAMDDYDEPADKGRWPFNVLARDAVVYSCGAIALPDAPVRHRHRAAELDLCRRLAAEAAGLMEWVELVRSSSLNSYLGPFFMAANEDAPVVEAITPDEIRRAFGETIYPPAQIRVELLREGEPWWQDIVAHYPDTMAEQREQALERWRALLRWFQGRPELAEPSFVVIGEEWLPDWEDQENFGCTFPRLLVGRSQAGSLVGVAGQVVQA
jgi:hypothetical protein